MTPNNQTESAEKKLRVYKIEFHVAHRFMESDGFWHCQSGPGMQQDLTLCGHALEEGEVKSKLGKITCPHCLSIISFCKSI